MAKTFFSSKHSHKTDEEKNETYKKIFIFVISIHTSAQRYFKIKPNNTQKKRHISSSFELSFLRGENEGVVEGENFTNKFKLLLFLWFCSFSSLVVWMSTDLLVQKKWKAKCRKINPPNPTYINQNFKGNRFSVDTLHNEFWKLRFWLHLKMAHTLLLAAVLLKQGSLQKENQKASVVSCFSPGYE